MRKTVPDKLPDIDFLALFFSFIIQRELDTMARSSTDNTKERDSSLTAEHNQNIVTGLIFNKQQLCFAFLFTRM